MAYEESRGQVLLAEAQQSSRLPDAAAWDTQILVLASDEQRAARFSSSFGGKPFQTEITGHPDWRAAGLKLTVASMIVLVSPVADLALLSELVAVRRFRSVPIVVFVDRSSREDISKALRLGVSAYIVDGLEPRRLPAILNVAVERHALTMTLRDELRKSQEDLAARKTIERAKGLLMTKSGLSEQDVYDSMRRMAMTQGKPMREVAETILAIFSIFP